MALLEKGGCGARPSHSSRQAPPTAILYSFVTASSTKVMISLLVITHQSRSWQCYLGCSAQCSSRTSQKTEKENSQHLLNKCRRWAICFASAPIEYGMFFNQFTASINTAFVSLLEYCIAVPFRKIKGDDKEAQPVE